MSLLIVGIRDSHGSHVWRDGYADRRSDVVRKWQEDEADDDGSDKVDGTMLCSASLSGKSFAPGLVL